MRCLPFAAALLACSLAPPALAQEACTAPGPQLVSDPAGDQNGGATNATLDIQAISIAEPNYADGVRRLTITLKVATLASLPQSASWRVNFTPPGSPAVRYFLSMNTEAGSTTPNFRYGTIAGTSLTTLGSAHGASGYKPDGTITLVINNAQVGNPAPGTVLVNIGGVTQQFVGAAGTGGFLTIDSTPNPGPDYTLVPADACPIVDADGDGVIDGNDFCPNTAPGTAVKPNGCPVVSSDSDGDGVSDEDDECANTPSGTPVNGAGCPQGLPEELLHFHGNNHDQGGTPAKPCVGNGQVDAAPAGCGGPRLTSSGDLDPDSPAAVFEDNSALVTTTGAGSGDPNWQWTPASPKTLENLFVLQFWGSCNASCLAFGGTWDVELWKNGVKVVEFAENVATPAAPDVPSLLTIKLKLAAPIELNGTTDRLSLVIRSTYIDSGSGSRIYYDSQAACPGGTGPCDSRVVFNAKDTDGDQVPDLIDECQGTPPNTEVDAAGCPAAAACAAGAGAAAQRATPASGAIAIDVEVKRDLAKLTRSGNYGAFVHFFRQGTRDQQDALLRALGLKKMYDFRRYTTSVFVEGPRAAFEALMTHPWIMRIEHNAPLRYLDATQSWTTRVRMAQEIVGGGPYYDASGNVLTGKGVTLGIIDSGMFGAHPDYSGLNRISHNYKLVNPAGGPVYYQDVGLGDSENGGGGHGTHVTGIVAGGGQQSNGGYPAGGVSPAVPGTFTSAAPDAKIIHWGNGAVLFVLSVDLAYQHLLDNIGLPTFQNLRAVNNSYGQAGGTPYSDTSTSSQLIKRIVGCNVNMVFAAGNDGGDGSEDLTSPTCKHPTPGVICVASYNDQGTGTVNGPLSAFSSRGRKGNPAEYPDIAAPGDLSTSTCAQATPTQAICTGGDDAEAETEWQPWYGTISGTSMASPNITGVIGVLAQAEPSLTAVEIERLLQRTARKVGGGYEPDPQHEGSTIHFGYGAGLVDIKAALDDLGIRKAGLPAAGEPWTIFEADADSALAGAADVVRLVMQEFATEAGEKGVEYRLSVRDSAAFGGSTQIAYRIEQNPNGNHYETTVIATPAGVTAPGPAAGNTAPAVSAGRIGNEIVVRILYSALGYPPTESPIHNIAVYTSNASGTLDFAPSPPNSTGAQAALQPMFGRPFTVRNAATLPEDTESVCEVPGKTKLRDDPGDQVQTPPGVDAAYDILSVHIAEPGEGDFAGKIVFTFKVRGFDGGVVPSGTRWALRFNGPKAPPAGQDDFFVMMTTEEGAQPTFVYGTTGVTGAARTFQIRGDLEPSSRFFPDGRILLVLDRANPLIGALAPGDTLTKIFPTVRAPATPNNTAIYDLGGEFEHTLIDPVNCLLAVPLAVLAADRTAGPAPLAVTFDATGSTPNGAPIASYTFDFGDGSAPVTQADPSVQHTYVAAGGFIATLTVTDTLGNASSNAAEVLIEVLGVNLAPVANAGPNLSGSIGTTVTLDGTGSSDPDGDELVYTWQQLSGPAVTLIPNADGSQVSFVVPQTDVPMSFLLTVSDGSLTDTDDVMVTAVPGDSSLTIGDNKVGGLPLGSVLVLALLGLARIRRRVRV